MFLIYLKSNIRGRCAVAAQPDYPSRCCLKLITNCVGGCYWLMIAFIVQTFVAVGDGTKEEAASKAYKIPFTKINAEDGVAAAVLDLLSLKSQITELYCHTHSSDSQLTQHSKLT